METFRNRQMARTSRRGLSRVHGFHLGQIVVKRKFQRTVKRIVRGSQKPIRSGPLSTVLLTDGGLTAARKLSVSQAHESSGRPGDSRGEPYLRRALENGRGIDGAQGPADPDGPGQRCREAEAHLDASGQTRRLEPHLRALPPSGPS